MRVCLFVAALLLCVGVVSGQTVTRQGYFNGTATLGGCLTANPADKQTYSIGVCVKTTAPNDTVLSSAIINDCSANGVISISRFNGSDSCNPANAQDVIDVAGVVNNTQYCNPEDKGVFATWSCSTVAPINSPIIVSTTAYPFLDPFQSNGATNNCTAPLAIGFNFTVGKCFPVQTPNPKAAYGVIANCINGLVSAVFYDSSTCTVAWNYTTNSFANIIIPIGPYAQTGAASGAGKQPAQPGSTCGFVPGFSFMNFTCISTSAAPTTATPTTPVPSGNATTATPTTGAPTQTPTSSSSTGTNGGDRSTIAFGIAVLMAPIIAAAAVFA